MIPSNGWWEYAKQLRAKRKKNLSNSLPDGCHPVETAPRDGTPIVGLYDDGEATIRWSQRPVCMLGPINGGFPPGWATTDDPDVDNNLPMDPPKAWKPVETTPEHPLKKGTK